MTDVSCPPALVTVTRGDIPESVHRVHVAVTDAAGRVRASAGDAGLVAFLRSSAKPLQALPLVESGAAAAFGLGSEELAIACASHAGMEMHTRAVASLLSRSGCSPADLECGVHPPLDPARHAALIAAGEAPQRIHNNCSGKHAGMLAVCRHLGLPTAGYLHSDHPLQQMITRIMTDMAGVQPILGVDGCGVPTFGLPLAAMATAYARLGSGAGLPPARAAAARRLAAAMAAHPALVSGPGHVNTDLLVVAGSRLLCKGGAEGVWCMALRAAGSGLGIGLKVEDGAGQAAEAAAIAILVALGLDGVAQAPIARYAHRAVRNTLGAAVGEWRVALPGSFCADLQGIGERA